MRCRLLCILLATLMLVSCLACAKTDENIEAPEDAASPSAPAEEQSPVEQEPEAEPQTPEDVGFYPVVDEVIDLTVFQGVAGFLVTSFGSSDDWNELGAYKRAEEVTNVHITWNFINQDNYSEKLNVMFASEEYSDFIQAAESYYSGGRDALVEDGVCYDLAPMLHDYAPDFCERIADNPDLKEYMRQITSDSGVITSIWTVAEAVTNGLVIRKDWVDKLGMELPTTIDELHDVLTAFKVDLGIKHPMLMLSTFSYNNAIFSNSFDVIATRKTGDIAWQVDDDGIVTASILKPEFKEYLMLLNAWYEEGLIDDETLNISNIGKFDDYILAGEVGFLGSNTNVLGASFAEQSIDPEYNMYPLADLKYNSDTTHLGPVEYTLDNNCGWAITTQCKYPEAALSYINWFFTEEGHNYANFGLENEVFTYDENGNRQLTELITNNPDGMTQSIAMTYYRVGSVPCLVVTESSLMQSTSEAYSAALEIWPSNRDNSHGYYGDLNAGEADIYSSSSGDISTCIDENISMFVIGEVSFDEYDDFIAKLYDLGIEALIEVKQAAYDRYIKR